MNTVESGDTEANHDSMCDKEDMIMLLFGITNVTTYVSTTATCAYVDIFYIFETRKKFVFT